MNIENKSIMGNNEKKCSVCNNERTQGGITILNNYICEECLEKITNTDVNDKNYYKLKEKIKEIILKSL